MGKIKNALSKNLSFDLLQQYPTLIITTTFGTGFLPQNYTGKQGKGGGLMGSLVALLFLQFPLLFTTGLDSWIRIGIQCFLITLSLVAGLLFIKDAEAFMLQTLGPVERHDETITDRDFNETNIDEVHGQLLAGLPVYIYPDENMWVNAIWLGVSFGIFRVLDTFKPWPINMVEKKTEKWSAFSIMIDDTAGGLISALIVRLLQVGISYIF